MIPQLVKTFSTFMEPKSALPCPQQLITGTCHGSDISESTTSNPISGKIQFNITLPLMLVHLFS
jgi:hypothetical protein